MNIEEIRAYCLSLHQKVSEEFPFNESTLVFKIGNKMFALLPLENNPPRINLKCDPEKAVDLRERHAWIIPGYHMNKTHWNTLIIDEYSDIKLAKELIKHSFDLIVSSLPGKIKATL